MNESDKGAYGHVLKYTGVFGGVQGLNVMVSLVRNKFVALLLGPSGMGLVTLFNTTVSFISQSTHFGISTSAVRQLSEFPDDSHPQVVHFVKVVRAWSLLTALLGMLVCIAIGPFLSSTTFAWGDHSLHFILLATERPWFHGMRTAGNGNKGLALSRVGWSAESVMKRIFKRIREIRGMRTTARLRL